MIAFSLLVLLVSLNLCCYAVAPEVKLELACSGKGEPFGPLISTQFEVPKISLLNEYCANPSSPLSENGLFLLKYHTDAALRVSLLALLWKKVSFAIGTGYKATGDIGNRLDSPASIQKSTRRKYFNPVNFPNNAATFMFTEIAGFLQQRQMKVLFFSSLIGVDSQSYQNLIRVISYMMRAEDERHFHFHEKASKAVTSIRQKWNYLWSSFLKPNEVQINPSIISNISNNLSLLVTEWQNASKDMMDMCISAIKFIGIALRMEEEGTAGTGLETTKRYLVSLYQFMGKRVEEISNGMMLESSHGSFNVQLHPGNSEPLPKDISSNINAIVRNSGLISFTLRDSLKLLVNFNEAGQKSFILKKPISGDLIDFHLNYIQLVGEALKSFTGLKLTGVAPIPNPLDATKVVTFAPSYSFNDLSYPRGAALLGAKFFTLTDDIDVQSLILTYLKRAKTDVIPLNSPFFAYKEDWKLLFVANLNIRSMKRAYVASEALRTMFELNRVDFSIAHSIRQSMNIWDHEKKLYFSQKLLFLEPAIEVSGNIALDMLQALSSVVRYALKWRKIVIRMETVRLHHSRLVNGLEILKDIDLERECVDYSLVHGEEIPVYQELIDLKSRLHALHEGLLRIEIPVSVQLGQMTDFSMYTAFLPTLLDFVNLYMNFFDLFPASQGK